MLIIPVMYVRGGSILSPSGSSATPPKSTPFDLAKDWFKAGAELVHIVDLDVPPTGPSPNLELIKKIQNELKLEVEIEASVRTLDTVEKYISAGAIRITLGAIAYQKPAFLAELCKHFPKKIATHIDVRHGRVQIKGWTVAPNKSALDYVSQFKSAGVDTIYYSDTEEEGVLKLADFGRMRDFLRKAMVKAYHTTDISSPNDIQSLVMLESYGLMGTLVSKSLYEGRIDLESAITESKDKGGTGLDEPTYTEEN